MILTLTHADPPRSMQSSLRISRYCFTFRCPSQSCAMCSKLTIRHSLLTRSGCENISSRSLVVSNGSSRPPALAAACGRRCERSGRLSRPLPSDLGRSQPKRGQKRSSPTRTSFSPQRAVQRSRSLSGKAQSRRRAGSRATREYKRMTIDDVQVLSTSPSPTFASSDRRLHPRQP